MQRPAHFFIFFVVFPAAILGAQSISSISPNPVAAGVTAVIAGSGFGASQGASHVLLNGSYSVPASGWSNTSISVPIPSNSQYGTSTVTVVVNGVSSNGVSATIIPPPKITSVSPKPVAQGATVIVTGSNFGSTQGASTLSSNGYILTPMSWSNTSVTATVPTNSALGNLPATITVGGATATAYTTVVATPVVTGINTASGPPTVGLLTTGYNFGSSQGNSTLTFNGTAITPLTWSANAVSFQVPNSATINTTVPIVLTIAGKNFTVQFNVTNPLACED